MNRRLVVAFLAATLAPLALSLWVTTALLERSLSHATTREMEDLSRALEKTGRELYQQSRESLKAAAAAGRSKPRRMTASDPAVSAFVESGDAERFELTGQGGRELRYLVRNGAEVLVYTKALGGVPLAEISGLLARSRERIADSRGRDLRRGYRYTLIVVLAGAAVLTLAVVLFFAYRVTRPVGMLTRALRRFAAGDLKVRVESGRRDEIGAAFDAFNQMASQLENSRERLVFLTRLSSWQALGRKMAHEVKNSLTPIRLTVEEMAARNRGHEFLDQASQIIVDEVTRLERRVRAFSDLAAEPPVNFADLDVNSILEERAGFLRSAHPEVIYNLRLAPGKPLARGDEDLVRGILTNLLENAAEAAGAGGVVLAVSEIREGRAVLEIHDSGAGLSLHAKETLFQPTISFKKTGMGLGLSIAHKSALLSGGEITLVEGELGGAAFRVTLPLAGGARRTEMAWARSAS